MARGSGHTKLPHAILDDKRLKSGHLALVWRLASHAQDWIVTKGVETSALGICENTYFKLLKDLERFGYISRKKAYRNGRVAGLTVKVDLTPKKQGSVGNPSQEAKPPNTKVRNEGLLRKNISKERRFDCDVIDNGDAV